jgi:broad specificity phosphatase PhoE
MKHPTLMSACLVSLVTVLGLPACKDGAGGASTSGGDSGGATAVSGGAAGGGVSGRDAGGGALSSAGAGGPGQGGSASTGGNGASTGGSSARTSNSGLGGGTSLGGSKAGDTVGTGGLAAGAGLTLYYIRHAEVVANTVDAGQVTIENADTLTELGLRQVEALTTYLGGLGITPDAIVVSPHLRAQRTIGPYLLATKLQGEVWMELAEASDKTATGAPVPTQPKYIKYYKATLDVPGLAFRDPARIEFWQNDNYESGLLMVMTARDLLLERYGRSGKTIIVVGHAIAGQMLIGLLRGDDLLNGPTTSGSSAVYLLNTGIMKLSQDAATGLFKLEGRNINKPLTK